METVFADIRAAFRALRRSPRLTIAALVTLVLGIGANTAIFSVVNGVLLRPLPYPDAARLVKIIGADRDGSQRYRNISRPDFLDFARDARSFDAMGAHSAGIGNATLTGLGEPDRLRATTVNAGFFAALGTTPALGRLFLPEETGTQPPDIVIASHAFWRDRTGSSPGIVGQTVILSGQPYTVIGVLPLDFQFPQPDGLGEPEIYFPMEFGPNFGRSGRASRALGRLKPGVTIAEAQAELSAIAARLERDFPTTNHEQGVRVIRLSDAIVGEARSTLVLLLGTVGLVLLIACANLASLQLAGATSRERETALRLALGAGRGRIVRLLLTESLVLALAGGGIALLVGIWATDLLVGLGSGTIPRTDAIRFDWIVLGYTSLIAIATGLAFGVGPALHATRADVADILRPGNRGQTAGPARSALRRTLVGAEVALAVVLLAGAGLLLKSFDRLTAVNPGFRADQRLIFGLSLPIARYPEGSQIPFYQQLYERLGALPGVRAVGATNILPLSGGYSCDGIQIDERPMPEGQNPCAEARSASTSYFDAMEMPLLRGRAFTEQDDAQSQRVVIISATMANRFWPGENPIGKTITYSRGETASREIVGIISDVRHFGLDREPTPEFYTPQAQQPSYHAMTLVVRTGGADPGAVAALIRRTVAEMDPLLPVFGFRPLSTVVGGAVAAPRFRAVLLASFALLAVTLAAVGIYGLVAYAAHSRTREMGVRMALGASRRDVLRLIVGQGMLPVAAGIVAGVGVALAVGGVIADLLFNVEPTDPIIMSAATVLILAIAGLGCYLPARRAARVEPTVALRHE